MKNSSKKRKFDAQFIFLQLENFVLLPFFNFEFSLEMPFFNLLEGEMPMENLKLKKAPKQNFRTVKR